MENIYKQIHTPIQLISSSHFLKLVTKILLPFSVLSVIISYPLLCNFHVLAYGLQLFSFNVGKNYMFLLCNGLLVFIVTSSGLIGSSSMETDFKAEKTLKSKEGSERELHAKSPEPKAIVNAKVIPEVDQDLTLLQGREHVPLVVKDAGEEDRNELVSVEEDEDEELGLMSNEELNKKCEDFIRKIKEGIQLEAQQLIMVQ
ncbi:uncharacterized protein LOC111305545 [Durio zibethinus]|uniref:Uncharacterized protein LOC111305545 n=1 Tax=Durio zibethinus TaxID=66656 RepID=A0A6P6A2E2_DURZI|nr:uncharacterized protein LOC111305545 [Durio zibethinus]